MATCARNAWCAAEVPLTLEPRLDLLPLGVAALVLAWNVTMAGWIASRRDRDRWFGRLTGLAGLLIAPAAVLALASATDAGARTITYVTWLWPVTCVLMVLQTATATARRLVSSSVGVPLTLYNLIVAAIALADYLVMQTGSAPLLLQGVVAARDAVLGIIMGRSALASPLVILVPLLAPAYPARWRSSALVRALLVLYAAATMTLLVMEWPRGVAAVRSYTLASNAIVPREASSLALGIQLLPDLSGLPTTRSVRAGRQLAERIQPDALLLVVDPDAVRTAGLDSLARVLAPYRGDGVRILVALAFDRDNAKAAARDPVGASRLRQDALERVLERLRPDVVLPMHEPLVPSARSETTTPALWWQAQFITAAAVVERVRPATRLLWVATRLDATDSARYVWASDSGSPVQDLGFAPTPSFGGLLSVEARLRAADRWAAARGATDQPHWILTVGLPRAHGDAAQSLAIRHVLAWSSSRRWVRGVIVGDPTDASTLTGLVSANGRERDVVPMLRQLLPQSGER